MAVRPPKPWEWVQDMPKKGGYESVRVYFTKRARGPPGWVLLAGTVGLTVASLAYYRHSAGERMYRDLAKSNEQYERAFVLQAVEEQSYRRRKKEMIDREREWMADKPDWVVNRPFFLTKRQDRPSYDPVDPRTLTPWSSSKPKGASE